MMYKIMCILDAVVHILYFKIMKNCTVHFCNYTLTTEILQVEVLSDIILGYPVR